MISVSSHINKLDALRKYMEIWVEEWHAKNIFERMDFGISQMSFDDIMKIYNQTGMLFYKKEDIPIDPPQELPDFDTWYNLYLTTNN